MERKLKRKLEIECRILGQHELVEDPVKKVEDGQCKQNLCLAFEVEPLQQACENHNQHCIHSKKDEPQR